MKLLLKIFFFFFIPVFTIAQQNPFVENWSNAQIDSLRTELRQTTNDTIRMRISRSLGWYYTEINRDSNLHYQTQQLTLARKLKLKIWEADALDGAGWVLAQLKNYPLSLQYFLDGMAILQNKDVEKNIWFISLFATDKNPATARINSLAWIHNDFAMLYKSTGNNKKELSTLLQGFKIGKSNNNHTVLSVISVNLAEAYLKTEKPDSALIYAREALDNMATSGYNIYKGMALSTIGNIYIKQKKYSEAKQYFDKSLIAYKLYKNITGIPNTFLSLGNLYNAMGYVD